MARLRRVRWIDWMHYKPWRTGDGGPVFDYTPTGLGSVDAQQTYPWYSTGYNSDWYTQHANGVGYLYPSGPFISSGALVCYQTVEPRDRMAWDWAIDYNLIAPDCGIYFMCDYKDLSKSSYRCRQASATKVYLEEMTALGTPILLGSYDYTIGSDVNYYRIRYFKENLQIEDGMDATSDRGSFILYASMDYDAMAEIGSCIGSPRRTTGNYQGFYIGALGSPHLHMFTIADDWYPLMQNVTVRHKLNSPSHAFFYTPKFHYERWDKMHRKDLVQIWVYDDDPANPSVNYEYLDFFGQINEIREYGKDQTVVIMNDALKMTGDGYRQRGAATGNTTNYLQNKIIHRYGGEYFNGASWYYNHRLLHGEDFKPGSVNVSGREDDGLSDLQIMRRMGLAEDFYIYCSAECNVWFTDLWHDRNIYVDCGSWNSRFLDFDMTQNTNQAVTRAIVYYDIGSAAEYRDNTYEGVLGSTTSYIGQHIDLHISGSGEAQAVASTLVSRQGRDTFSLDCYFLARFAQLRPGDLITFSLPHIGVGGDYATDHGSWTAQTMAVIEKEWSTSNMVVRLKLNETWVDGANTKGIQYQQSYVRDMWGDNWAMARSADANHL